MFGHDQIYFKPIACEVTKIIRTQNMHGIVSGKKDLTHVFQVFKLFEIPRSSTVCTGNWSVHPGVTMA